MKFKFLFIFLFLFIIPFISSAGLTVSPNVISVEKIAGSDKLINIFVTNTEAYTMYNISVDSNNILQMPVIPELGPGMGINVTATISNDNDFNGVVKLQGFYISNLGQNFETINVNVNYYSGLSICDQSIVESDSVILLMKCLMIFRLWLLIRSGQIQSLPRGLLPLNNL